MTIMICVNEMIVLLYYYKKIEIEDVEYNNRELYSSMGEQPIFDSYLFIRVWIEKWGKSEFNSQYNSFNITRIWLVSD